MFEEEKTEAISLILNRCVEVSAPFSENFKKSIETFIFVIFEFLR